MQTIEMNLNCFRMHSVVYQLFLIIFAVEA